MREKDKINNQNISKHQNQTRPFLRKWGLCVRSWWLTACNREIHTYTHIPFVLILTVYPTLEVSFVSAAPMFRAACSD